MAVSALLAPVEDLATLLNLSLDAGDAYATLILRGASNAARDYGHEAGWVRLESGSDLPGPGQKEAPQAVQDIVLQIAARAYVNPSNLSRRTTGPMSDSFFENGLYGLEPSAAEIARLRSLGSVGGGINGIWTLPIAYGQPVEPIMVPTSPPNLGDQYIADSNQFPYAEPEA